MKVWVFSLAAVALAAGCAPDGSAGPLRPPPPTTEPPLSPADAAERYAAQCAECHGAVGEGGFGPRLIDLDTEHEALVRTIHDTMPQNTPESCIDGCAESLATFIEERLRSDALQCDAVPPALQRLRMLNRREYAASIRDLLGMEAPRPEPSCEPTVFRFDPGGRSLSRVSVAGDFNGWDANAWPMENAGGAWTLTRALPIGDHPYKFVLDGSEWIADPANPNRSDDGFGGFNSVVEVTCDADAPAGEAPVDPSAELPLEARPEGYLFDNSAEALQVTSIHLDEFLRAAERSVDAIGETGLEALVACSDGRGVCARPFVARFGQRALRRPLTDEEAARYERLIQEAPDDRAGYRAAVIAMLVSPSFLYRSELGVERGDGRYALTGWEMASALSYGLWGTTPDSTLLDAAAAGELDDEAGIARHAERLLRDPRARAVVAAFTRQWLGIESVEEATKVDPRFDAALGRAMVEETERFALDVVFEGSGRFEDLLSADYTFVDERLAALDGIEGVRGSDHVRANYPDGARAGLLAHASVLSATAHSDQSSPILRGLFVRQRLLCQDFPAPPANAGGVPDVDPNATTRERFRQHTEDAFCASCHQYIDPIGFGFESFGPIGAWRTTENGHPVETGGNMVDLEYIGVGTSAPFETLPELAALLVDSDAAPSCFARRVHQFVHGAEASLDDRCAVESAVERFRASGGDIRALLVSTFTADDFRFRRAAR